MGRIMAVDYGTRRVGLAVTDPLQMIASPLTTVHPKDIFTFLKEYFDKNEVDVLVVGYPKDLMNRDSDNAQHVKGFLTGMKKHFPAMPTTKIDERFTSKMALEAMIAGGSKRKDRMAKTGNIDKVSAAIILQSYLEQHTR